jgi:hypothetical protein
MSFAYWPGQTLQTLSISGDVLSINPGNSVVLPSAAPDEWYLYPANGPVDFNNNDLLNTGGIYGSSNALSMLFQSPTAMTFSANSNITLLPRNLNINGNTSNSLIVLQNISSFIAGNTNFRVKNLVANSTITTDVLNANILNISTVISTGVISTSLINVAELIGVSSINGLSFSSIVNDEYSSITASSLTTSSLTTSSLTVSMPNGAYTTINEYGNFYYMNMSAPEDGTVGLAMVQSNVSSFPIQALSMNLIHDTPYEAALTYFNNGATVKGQLRFVSTASVNGYQGGGVVIDAQDNDNVLMANSNGVAIPNLFTNNFSNTGTISTTNINTGGIGTNGLNANHIYTTTIDIGSSGTVGPGGLVFNNNLTITPSLMSNTNTDLNIITNQGIDILPAILHLEAKGAAYGRVEIVANPDVTGGLIGGLVDIRANSASETPPGLSRVNVTGFTTVLQAGSLDVGPLVVPGAINLINAGLGLGVKILASLGSVEVASGSFTTVAGAISLNLSGGDGGVIVLNSGTNDESKLLVQDIYAYDANGEEKLFLHGGSNGLSADSAIYIGGQSNFVIDQISTAKFQDSGSYIDLHYVSSINRLNVNSSSIAYLADIPSFSPNPTFSSITLPNGGIINDPADSQQIIMSTNGIYLSSPNAVIVEGCPVFADSMYVSTIHSSNVNTVNLAVAADLDVSGNIYGQNIFTSSVTANYGYFSTVSCSNVVGNTVSTTRLNINPMSISGSMITTGGYGNVMSNFLSLSPLGYRTFISGVDGVSALQNQEAICLYPVVSSIGIYKVPEGPYRLDVDGGIRSNKTSEFSTINVSSINGLPSPLFYTNSYLSTTYTVAGNNVKTPIYTNQTVVKNVGGFTYHTSTIGVPMAGTYEIGTSLQFATSSGSARAAFFWFQKNGTDIPQSGSKIVVPNNGEILGTCAVVVDCAAGDELGIAFSSSDTNMSIHYISTNGVYPSIPSNILTIKLLSL